MKRLCYALDLKDDPELIAKYEFWHKAENSWPEIRKSIIGAGIIDMQIYRTGNRLFMIIEAEDGYCQEEKEAMDAANPKVRAWERLMGQFQKPLPWAKRKEKWVLMEQIYGLW